MIIPPSVQRANEQFTGREWALAAIARWWQDSSSPVFCLTGPPGYGKTTLAAWLAGAGPAPTEPEPARQLAMVREALTAVHFCSREAGRGTVDPRGFARSLTEQLQARLPSFPTYAARTLAPTISISQTIENLYGTGHAVENLEVFSAEPGEAFENGVHAPLSAMVDAGVRSPVLVLVDGLDDALDAGRGPSLVALLATLLDLAPTVRMIISCRPDDRIQAALDRDSTATLLDLDGASVREAGDDDVRRYLERRLSDQGDGSAAPETRDARRRSAAINELVDAAEGNFQYVEFLLREIGTGARPLSDPDRLPQGLDELYAANLRRLQDTRAITDADWEAQFRPLLGLVAVSDPVAPRRELASWVQVEDVGLVNARAEQLRQIMPYEAELDGWRLFHRSMREFLFEAQIRSRGQIRPNRYCIAPGPWHWQIAEHYLGRASVPPERWASLGPYGLARIVHHLIQAYSADLSRPVKDRCLQRLEELVTDPTFRDAQRLALNDHTLIADDARGALEVLAATQRLESAFVLVRQLATDASPVVRIVAVEWLTTLHRHAPDAVLGTIAAMLADSDTTAWRVALHAAYEIGDAARSVFVDIARHGSGENEELRRVAGLALTLRWRPEPGNFTDRLLADLAGGIIPLPTRQNSKTFEFIADVSIAIYINNCENPAVTQQTAALWRRILKDRMHLGLVNRPGMDKLIARVAARVYSQRVLETALFAEVSDPALFFTQDQEGKQVAHRNLHLLDPGRLIGAADEGDLALMFDADLPLIRIVAAMAVSIHMHAHSAETAPLVRRLSERLSGRARLWLLLSFSAPLPPAPAAWPDLVADLTSSLLRDEPDIVDHEDVATLPTFDLLFMPLGRANGSAGRPMTLLTEQLRSAPDDPTRLGRLLRAWGPVGVFHPGPVLEALRAGLPARWPGRPWPGFVDGLATIRVVHTELVDLFLEEISWPGLREQVLAASDLPSVWRYIWWLGLYKNAVHQALHYPRMRSQLLVGGLTALLEASSPNELVKNFSLVPLAMLREADYDLLRWTEQ